MTIRNTITNATGAAILAVFAAASITSLTAHEAPPLQSPVCGVEVLVDGRPLEEHRARGTTYLEALQGREYEVRLINNSNRRIAVALAIDGLNSIDAKNTDPKKASKWVLGPYETTTISGWQTSSGTARRFFFTTEDHSYGEWLGRTEDLGVIEAVVFRERLPEPAPPHDAILSQRSPETGRRTRPSSEAAPGSAGKAEADELAATGIGREIDHRVRRVRLDLEDRPAHRIRLRYEYRQQLVHLGVLPSPEEEEALARRERASGFSDFDFAPDPFSRGR